MPKTNSMRLLIIGFLSLLTVTVNAQSEINPQKITIQELNVNAENVIFSNDKIEILVQKQIVLDSKNGIHHERVTFAFVNKTDQSLTLNFNKLNMYRGSSSTGEGQDYSVTISAHSSKTYSAENNGKTFYSFSKDLKGTIKAELQYIILNNIEVV